MRILKKLGQTATEYLIILAVVIVIALIVVGVMGGIPGIGKSGKAGADKAYWATAKISLEQVGISAVQADSIKIRNSQDDTVIMSSVIFDLNGVRNEMLTENVTLASGESKLVSPTATNLVCTAGNSFSYNVEMTYKMGATGAEFTDKGHAIGGTCAN
ncbi:MAG: hypothetical protein WC755_02470 [Candidatus Woesearchaeota archaeon]|jgi:hypothetical protein